MSNDWFSSDWHLFHKKILDFCYETRMGSSVEEMNELLVENHNKLVKPNDNFYHLGDFSFGSTEDTLRYLKRLNGKKHFIRGNHDKKLDSGVFRNYMTSYNEYKSVKVGGKSLILFHFPIESWDRMRYGSIHLHGHMHGKVGGHDDISILPNRMDIGIDTRPNGDMCPWHFDEILYYLKNNGS